MVPKIQKILYATDLSENSAYAFRYAIDSAKKHDASIVVLHVLEKMPPFALALVGSQLREEKRREIFDEKIASRWILSESGCRYFVIGNSRMIPNASIRWNPLRCTRVTLRKRS
jgi:nucleotide-binding universal stress UspA family protein